MGTLQRRIIAIPNIMSLEREEYIKNPEDLRILLVEDNEFVLQYLSRCLRNLELRYEHATSYWEALDRITDNSAYDLLITDINIPGGNGIDLIKELHPNSPNLKTLIISGGLPPEDIDSSDAIFLSKPFRMQEFYVTLTDLLRKENP